MRFNESSVIEDYAMEHRVRQVKPYLYGIMIFTTLGITLANELLTRIGIEGNRIALFSVAFLLAAILLSRNLVMVAIVVLGVLALNLPEESLRLYYLDRDILLAMIGAAIVLPSVYQLMTR